MIKTFLDGTNWCATFEDFKNLEESPAGFGKTPEEATEELIKNRLGVAHKILENIKPEQEYAESLIQQVKDYILETQSNFSCDFAELQYRKGYVRTSYDTKALDKYAKDHEEILEFRKTTESKPTTALKWL